jgi:hypothetical protein
VFKKKINFIPELRDWGLELVVVAMACNGELGTYGTHLKFSTQLTSFRLSLSLSLSLSLLLSSLLKNNSGDSPYKTYFRF